MVLVNPGLIQFNGLIWTTLPRFLWLNLRTSSPWRVSDNDSSSGVAQCSPPLTHKLLTVALLLSGLQLVSILCRTLFPIQSLPLRAYDDLFHSYSIKLGDGNNDAHFTDEEHKDQTGKSLFYVSQFK